MFVKLFFRRGNCIFRLYAGHILRKNLCTAASAEANRTVYKYLLFLDLEATCDNEKKIEKEIIEFPCVKVNLNTLAEEARFHHYVRPVVEPILTPFCTKLTGILQEVVDEAKAFPEVYQLFEEWRQQEGLTEENSMYVTSGDWDLGHMIPIQCARSNIEIPSHMKEWVDIKKLFGNNNRKFFNSFSDVMRYYGLQFEGRAHSGIDDTLNMVRAAKKMIEAGIEFKPTCRLVNLKVEIIRKPLTVAQGNIRESMECSQTGVQWNNLNQPAIPAWQGVKLGDFSMFTPSLWRMCELLMGRTAIWRN